MDPIPPTTGQLVLLGVSVVMLFAGGFGSLRRVWKGGEALRIFSKACMYSGLSAAIGVIVWHSISRGQWVPLNDSFESLVWLAVLLGLFVMYTQRVKPLGGLDWFVMPIVILLLIGAAIFGRFDVRGYHPLVTDAWLWVHRMTSFFGALAFAIAAAGGAMYIIIARRLRTKKPMPPLGSLERIERLTMHSVTAGFALLTVSLITGLLRLYHYQGTSHVKMAMATLAWIVYAIVLHAPINPRFRGRKAALLSIFGFLLMIGTLLAVLLMPGGKS